MKLFLCSHFSSVGNLIKEDIEMKNIAANCQAKCNTFEK